MRYKSVLERLYSKVEEEIKPTTKYHILQNDLLNTKDELYRHISEDDKEDVEKVVEILYDMATEENKQFFKEGFMLASKLLAEVFYSRNN